MRSSNRPGLRGHREYFPLTLQADLLVHLLLPPTIVSLMRTNKKDLWEIYRLFLNQSIFPLQTSIVLLAVK
jgi:hypothetical protein